MFLYICQLFQQFTFLFAYWIVYYKLLKSNFKYSGKTVFALFLLYVILWYTTETFFPDNAVLFSLVVLYRYAYQAFTYKSKIVNSYIMEFYVVMLGTILPNIATGFIAVATSLFSASDAEWFNKSTAGPDYFLVISLCLMIGNYIAYKLCLAVRDVIMNDRSAVRYFTLIFGAMLYAVNIAMKAVIYTDYGMSPSGIPMIIDMTSMSVCLFTYALAMIRKIKIQTKEKTEIEKRIKENYDDFIKKYRLQQRLREINHEVRNYLVSGSVDNAKKIEEYCDETLAEIYSRCSNYDKDEEENMMRAGQ